MPKTKMYKAVVLAQINQYAVIDIEAESVVEARQIAERMLEDGEVDPTTFSEQEFMGDEIVEVYEDLEDPEMRYARVEAYDKEAINQQSERGSSSDG